MVQWRSYKSSNISICKWFVLLGVRGRFCNPSYWDGGIWGWLVDRKPPKGSNWPAEGPHYNWGLTRGGAHTRLPPGVDWIPICLGPLGCLVSSQVLGSIPGSCDVRIDLAYGSRNVCFGPGSEAKSLMGYPLPSFRKASIQTKQSTKYRVFNLKVDYYNHMLQISFFKSTIQNTAQIVPKCGAFDDLIHRKSRNYLHISQMAFSQDYIFSFLTLYDSFHL